MSNNNGSSETIPQSTSTPSPINHRRTLNASQMDAIGRMDDDTGQSVDPDKSKLTPPASPARPALETVEIATQVDVGRPVEAALPMEIEQEEEEDDDDVDADLERLLASSDVETARTKRPFLSSSSSPSAFCCSGPGNTFIIFPRIYRRTGWGICGPHWFGPFFVVLIILWASHYFIKLSLNIGPITTTICVLATIATTFNLCAVSFHDPGIVTTQTPPDDVDMSRWRWCDFCKYVTIFILV